MPKTDSKHIKIEIESTNGTKTDVTHYITSLEGPFKYEEPIKSFFCSKCLKPYPEYKLFKRVRLYLWKKFHKCGEPPFVLGIKNAKVSLSEYKDD